MDPYGRESMAIFPLRTSGGEMRGCTSPGTKSHYPLIQSTSGGRVLAASLVGHVEGSWQKVGASSKARQDMNPNMFHRAALKKNVNLSNGKVLCQIMCFPRVREITLILQTEEGCL